MLSSRPSNSSFGRRAGGSLPPTTLCLPLGVSAVALKPGSSRRAEMVAVSASGWMACAYIASFLSLWPQHPAAADATTWGQHVAGGTASPPATPSASGLAVDVPHRHRSAVSARDRRDRRERLEELAAVLRERP